MGKNVILKEQGSETNEILKITALVYFKEALLKQEFEGCAELIQAAKNLGAQQGEIDQVIADSLRGGNKGRRNEASTTKNRLLTLKEEK